MNSTITHGGRKVCVRCKKSRSLKQFKLKNNKPHSYCESCRLSYYTEYNQKRLSTNEQKEKERERGRLRYRRIGKISRLERKKKLIATFGGKCKECGYDKNAAALDFHHKDPATKVRSVSYLLAIQDPWGWEAAVDEAKKCDLLCSNCHREHTYDDPQFRLPNWYPRAATAFQQLGQA